MMKSRGMSSAEGKYSLYRQGSSGWSTLRNEEFQEEDVWGILGRSKELKKSNSDSYRESSSMVSRRRPTASRMIPKATSSNSGTEPKIIQQSAPVNIPDWSKIYGSSSKKPSNTVSRLDDDDDHGNSDGVMYNSWDSDEEEEDDGSVVPPHEWIARKLARSQITSFSVCEGVGRTLKGRDLSNVRNAVLTKTGFLE
ncbi:uncharacterized protein [Coffea arabica]|uniref:Uncharacterized protein isoform X2 n=1 Tax=Coffea arabica TaxID=13443 RepID=A0ABM4UDQ0_COFAR